VAQLQLLAKMAFGRSYNCIAHLELSFPYVTLVAMARNAHLPCSIRAAATDLLRVLYVDRY